MTKQLLKTCLRIGLVTAGAAVVYELSVVLLNYHYFQYEYYITAIGIAALIAGIIVANKYHLDKQKYTPPNLAHQLTAKEWQILELINGGKSNKEIAALNFIEISTVKTHINNIYCKLGVKNRREAVEACRKYSAQPKSTLSPPLEI